MFLVHKYIYLYNVNSRNGLIGIEIMGIDTTINFLLQLLRKVWDMYNLALIAHSAIMDQKQFFLRVPK